MAYRTRFEPPSHSRNETKKSYPVKDVIPCLVEAQKECKNCGARSLENKCKYCGAFKTFPVAKKQLDNDETKY